MLVQHDLTRVTIGEEDPDHWAMLAFLRERGREVGPGDYLLSDHAHDAFIGRFGLADGKGVPVMTSRQRTELKYRLDCGARSEANLSDLDTLTAAYAAVGIAFTQRVLREQPSNDVLTYLFLLRAATPGAAPDDADSQRRRAEVRRIETESLSRLVNQDRPMVFRNGKLESY